MSKSFGMVERAMLENLRQRITWQRIPVDELRIIQPRREMKIALVYAVFFVFLAVIIGYLIKIKPLPFLGAASLTDDVWYVFVFKIGFLLIVPCVWFYRQGYTIHDLMPSWKLEFKSIIVLVLALFAGLSLNLLQGHLNLIVSAAENFSTSEYFARIVTGIVIALVQAGFPEEFVFRGILQTRIEKVYGRIPAISITVLLFTAWHIPTRYFLSHGVEGTAGDLISVVLGTGIPVMISALIFGLIWDRYRCFLPLVAAHWGVDMLPSVLSYLGIVY